MKGEEKKKIGVVLSNKRWIQLEVFAREAREKRVKISERKVNNLIEFRAADLEELVLRGRNEIEQVR